MRVTATNGNRRNLIEGQRVTVRLEDGQVFCKTLPAGNAIKRKRYAAELIDFIRAAAVLEGVHRYAPIGRQGAALIEFFATNKARRVVVHGKRGIV
jgi:hypothetical protein